MMGTKQIESVYCDFTKLPTDSGTGIGSSLNNYVFYSYKSNSCLIFKLPDFQTWIGQFDVKSSSVYFYVQRSTSFSTENVPIPFEVTRLNVGNAMNAASGIFTASRPGTYFFSFSGLASQKSFISPQLYLNGNLIGTGMADVEALDYPTFSIQSTLQLNARDEVSLKLNSGGTGYLFDDGAHYSHFTGWLLQEDLSY